MRIRVTEDVFRLTESFTISRGSRTEARVLTVVAEADGVRGRGECVPYARYGETTESVKDQVLSFAATLTEEAPRDIRSHLPPGAARNAIDCALLDWRAKRAGRRVWDLLGEPVPKSVATAYTLSLGSPDAMREAAARHARRPLLKVKLGGEGDMARLEAVRLGAPSTRIVIDANEGWSAEEYGELAPHLVRLGVEMVEQPLPVGADDMLAEIDRPLPVCADESCHDRGSLSDLKGKYDMINIKLDKTGGLTEALALRDRAREDGYRIMVGCMVGSSLAMAPATIVAQGAEVVDLDGPLLLAEDRDPPLRYVGSEVYPPEAELWG